MEFTQEMWVLFLILTWISVLYKADNTVYIFQARKKAKAQGQNPYTGLNLLISWTSVVATTIIVALAIIGFCSIVDTGNYYLNLAITFPVLYFFRNVVMIRWTDTYIGKFVEWRLDKHLKKKNDQQKEQEKSEDNKEE